MRHDSRTVLSETIGRVLDSPDQIDPGLFAVIPDPKGLDSLEKSAWVQLLNWSHDAELRNRHPAHAEFSRKRLMGLRRKLEAYPSLIA